MALEWWRSAVVYQVYPRSFADSDGDGIGDLAGVTSKLGYLSWLGVNAIWLSPFYPSPMDDFGYDVSDYCAVDPVFGDMEGFERLVEEAHALGIKVLIDWVPNHTSDRHPWFVESRSSKTSAKRDWYIWRPGAPDRPPNNYRRAFGEGPAWSFDEATQEWYLHLFLPSQPDLNWSNPEVADAMHQVLRFWLDRGVDGFRIDVAHGLGKDMSFPDAPPGSEDLPWSSQNDTDATHEILRGVRRVLASYPGDRVAVGEVYLLSTAKVARYYGAGDELHLAFNFPPLWAPFDAAAWRDCIGDVVRELGARDAWPTWVLSNHDASRHRSRYGGSLSRAQAAAVLLLTLRGTPFMYQGEELGLQDAVVPAGQRVDPAGRDACRAPVPWDGSERHGWPATPWLPFPPDATTLNVASERRDPSSMLNLYRRLLAARHSSPALSLGSFEELPAPDGVLAYKRASGEDVRVVVVNLGQAAAAVELPASPGRAGWVVEVASDGAGEGGEAKGAVSAEAALVLRPA